MQGQPLALENFPIPQRGAEQQLERAAAASLGKKPARLKADERLEQQAAELGSLKQLHGFSWRSPTLGDHNDTPPTDDGPNQPAKARLIRHQPQNGIDLRQPFALPRASCFPCAAAPRQPARLGKSVRAWSVRRKWSVERQSVGASNQRSTL